MFFFKFPMQRTSWSCGAASVSYLHKMEGRSCSEKDLYDHLCPQRDGCTTRYLIKYFKTLKRNPVVRIVKSTNIKKFIMRNTKKYWLIPTVWVYDINKIGHYLLIIESTKNNITLLDPRKFFTRRVVTWEYFLEYSNPYFRKLDFNVEIVKIKKGE